MKIPIANPSIGEEEAKAVFEVVQSGWISMGRKVEAFEQALSTLTKARFAIAFNNGTSSLHATLCALGIGPGDEVIVPSLTYISSANVVLYQGANLVLCDCDPKTWNVTPDDIRKKLTKKTKAIITVDLKGMPVDYDGLSKLAKEANVHFIADSAESLGAGYKGMPVGSQADMHSFSFFANKNITTGEGGAVVTNNEEIYRKLRIIRNQGQDYRYHHIMLGNNYRMTDVIAAIGLEQLKKLSGIIARKEQLVRRYKEVLGQADWISFQEVPAYVTQHSWYMFSIALKPQAREDARKALEAKGIETRLSFPPVHIQPYYVERLKFKPHDFPFSCAAYASFLDIPIWVGMGKERQDYVINTLLELGPNLKLEGEKIEGRMS